MLFGAGGLPRHSGDQVGAQVPSPDCLTLRLASNRIPTFRWDIYSAVTFVTEAIRTKKYLTPIIRLRCGDIPESALREYRAERCPYRAPRCGIPLMRTFHQARF